MLKIGSQNAHCPVLCIPGSAVPHGLWALAQATTKDTGVFEMCTLQNSKNLLDQDTLRQMNKAKRHHETHQIQKVKIIYSCSDKQKNADHSR